MGELLSTLVGIFVPLFAVSNMLTVGFRYPVRAIVEPLRDILGVITAVVANFVLVPLLAIGILRLIPLETPMATGLIVVASAAGAPLVIRLTQAAREDVAFAASILVLLLLVTMIYLPLVIPRLAPEGVSISVMSISRPLLMTMLLPLFIAFILKALWPRLAHRLLPWVGKIANIALYIMIAATVLGNLNKVIGVFGTGAILAALLLIAGAFIIGYLIGTVDKEEKIVLGFATAQRNFAAANVVAIQSFANPDMLVMTVVCSTVAMLLIPFSVLLGKRKAKIETLKNKDGEKQRRCRERIIGGSKDRSST
ncbi:MAG TPA: hypothetical protein VF251_07345 [Pyrinomonadaceae bacterium]